MISSFFPGLVVLGFYMLFKKFRVQQDNNDTNSSTVTHPSPPTSLSQNRLHNVFPSFHGEDVRKSIFSHLLASFKRKGIYTFIDNNIVKGNSISPELIEAIRISKIAVVLFSKNYASSTWCLNELAEIVDCKENRGQIVIPIFYEVNPSDVKKQAGHFRKAFKKTCKGKTKENIEKWKKALTDVATIAGEHSDNWSFEADMIEKITTDVLNKLSNSTPSKDFEHIAKMRDHMERMKSLLKLDLDEVRMIGIWGPHGIGKTSIARFLFNQFSSSFQLSAIMDDVKGSFPRPCFDEYNVQLKLQNQMLSKITNDEEHKISHLGAAPDLFKDKKVLLVIDEVDDKGQLDALAKKKSWFGAGSRIIVTTEDRSLLKAHDINLIYEVESPSSVEAFQIFCMHAFGEKHPPNDGFNKLAKEVSYVAGVLPLGLKMLGSALHGKTQEQWKSILPRLLSSRDGRMESIVKFSYEALCDEDKYLFLYISCMFTGELPLKVEDLLASRFQDVNLGLHILTEKSLISSDYYERIKMHDLVWRFGIETSRRPFIHSGITKRELWVDERDICQMLTGDTTDTNHLIAINVNWNKIEENIDISDRTLTKMADLQFIRVSEDGISPSELRSLIFHSPNIRSLSWWSFGNVCLPSTFNTEFLVNLVMIWSKLQILWEDNKVLENLKWMDLSHSKYLKELPDLSTATELQKLNLNGCESLVKLPDLSTATKLGKLNLNGCESLEELPDLPTATKLKKLKLLDCSSLLRFPSSSVDFNNLEKIDLRGCISLVELPYYIGTAKKIQRLVLEGCSSLVKLPMSIGDLVNLQEINLEGCSTLVEIPFSIGNLINLEKINVGDCSLLEIPFSIGKLQKLKSLEMEGCWQLEALPTNINLESLETLALRNCSQLKSFPEISTNISYLDLRGTAINDIPLTIMLWPHLSDLHLRNCNNLVSLPQFPDSLIYLDASNCESLERLDCSFNNPEIELVFSNCFKLNQEARDLIINTSCKLAVLPGTEVPACFNYCRGTGGGLVTIKLNESTLPTSLRFKVCFTLVKADEETSDGEDESSDDEDESADVLVIDIMVKQKDHIFPCRPSSPKIHKGLREHIYIFEVAFEAEVEEVTSAELVSEFKPKHLILWNEKDSWMWKIGELGLMQI